MGPWSVDLCLRLRPQDGTDSMSHAARTVCARQTALLPQVSEIQRRLADPARACPQFVPVPEAKGEKKKAGGGGGKKKKK